MERGSKVPCQAGKGETDASLIRQAENSISHPPNHQGGSQRRGAARPPEPQVLASELVEGEKKIKRKIGDLRPLMPNIHHKGNLPPTPHQTPAPLVM